MNSSHCLNETISCGTLFDKIIQNIVIIKFCHTLPFDGETAGTSEATGVVVDAINGYVLMNRHVAGPGPFWGSCLFDTRYDIPCEPRYIDPVHDFAFAKYDPEAIQDLGLAGLALSRESVRVGQRCLVIGNDGGETRSIINGVISRVHRNAPNYAGFYSDFNINYYQANMNLSGGMSGSPAIGEDGSILGIVSGHRGAICYILPVVRILKALKHLQDGTVILRGSIQCQFSSTPLHECRRLGLDLHPEGRLCGLQSPSGTLLVAKTVLDGGPASKLIATGDILLSINRSTIHSFDQLEDLLDDTVGEEVTITLLRDGNLATAGVRVENLDKLTPDSLLSVGNLHCHNISYVQAMKYGVSLQGVCVTESDEPSLIGDGLSGWAINSIHGQIIKSIDDAFKVIRSLKRGQRTAIVYSHLENPDCRRTCVITIDAPGGIKKVTRDTMSASWRSETTFLESAPNSSKPTSSSTSCNIVSRVISRVGNRQCTIWRYPRVATTISSLVHVESRAYFGLDGYSARFQQGLGLVIDSVRGLVVASRVLIPHNACHITLTFGSIKAEGRLAFLHPYYCYVIVKYDTSLMPPVSSIRLSSRRARAGTKVKFVHFTQPEQILHGSALVLRTITTSPQSFEIVNMMHYRPINANLIGINVSPEQQDSDGVLVAKNGSVLALWLPSLGGISAPQIRAVLSNFQGLTAPKPFFFPAEMEAISVDTATALGVPPSLTRAVEGASSHTQMFRVKNAYSDPMMNEDCILQGDIILKMDGNLCKWSDFDVVSLRTFKATVWRGPFTKTLEFKSACAEGIETSRWVEFHGAVIQLPHLLLRLRVENLPSQVFVNDIIPGSPAEHFTVPPEAFITALNGVTVCDFGLFVGMIMELPKAQKVTVTVVRLSGVTTKHTILPNNAHFPLMERNYNVIA